MWGVLERDVIYAARMRALAGFMMFVATLVGIFAAMAPLLRASGSKDQGSELPAP
jgi:hypothetical protein